MQQSSVVQASGIPPIDRVLGGIPEGRFVLIGGPSGTGKSTACLQFLRDALRRGETTVLLTQHRLNDLRSHAQRVGLDLRSAVRDERLVLLRFAPSFGEQIAFGISPDSVVGALRREVQGIAPTRIAIDSIAPFLDGGSRAAARIEALAQFLESMGATTLITYGGDLPGADRSLEPLTQRAAAILRLTREERGRLRLERVNARFESPASLTVCYALTGGRIECVDEETPRLAARQREPRERPVVILHTHESPDEDLRALVGRFFHVEARPANGERISDDAGALLVEASHPTLPDAIRTVRRLAHGDGSAPVIVVSRYSLRSLDRARLLRAGADDCLVHESGAAEFFARLEAAIARGRTARRVRASTTEEPDDAGASRHGDSMIDRAAFARALAEHVARDDLVQYSVVSLGIADDEIVTLPELTTLANRTMRARSGDLVTMHGDSVLVYLHGARRPDAAAFLDRLRPRWASIGTAPLRVEALSYPADEPRLRRLIAAGDAS